MSENSRLVTHYSRLGVRPGDDVDKIRTSYYSLARQHHPDKGGSYEAFQPIVEAYQILSSSAARTNYDKELRLLHSICKLCEGQGYVYELKNFVSSEQKDCPVCGGIGYE